QQHPLPLLIVYRRFRCLLHPPPRSPPFPYTTLFRSREGYRLGVPNPGLYREIMNTDAALYGGSNVGNMGGQQSADQPAQGRPQSLVLTLPPLAAIYLKWSPQS